MAMVAVNDMFTDDVIADPYTYYGRLEEDPVHWNDKYALWVITRHDDVVWMTRHHELFSNAFFRHDPRRRIQPSRRPTNRSTTTCGNIKRTNSSSLIVPSISRCAKSSTAISPPGRWRPGAALSRMPSPSSWMQPKTRGTWTS